MPTCGRAFPARPDMIPAAGPSRVLAGRAMPKGQSPAATPGQDPITARETWLALLLVLGLGLLAFGTYMPFARFFWDEWNILPLGLAGGARGMADGLYHHRAFVHHIHALGYALLGPHPVAWQVASLLLRGAAALLGWWLVRHLFPGRREVGLGLAAVIMVFPGYAHFPMGLFAFLTYISFFLTTASFCLTVRSYTAAGRTARVASFLGALALLGAATIGYEAFWGLELFRPLLILLVVSRLAPDQPLPRRLGRTLAGWLPYLALCVPYLFWRVFIFRSTKTFINPTDHLSGPGLFSLDVIGRTLERLYVALVSSLSMSWSQELLDLAANKSLAVLLLGLALGLAGAGLVALVFRGQPKAEPGESGRIPGLFGVGFFCALLSAPFAGLLNESTNQIKLISLALVLAGLLGLAIWSARKQHGWRVLDPFLGVGCGFGVCLALLAPFRYWGLSPHFLLRFWPLCLGLALAGLLVWGFWRRRVEGPPPLGPDRSSLVLVLGGLALLLTGFSVPVLAGSPCTIGGEGRYYPVAFLGLGLFLSALFCGLASRRAAVAMLGVLVVLGIMGNNYNGDYFRQAGRQMDELAWQMHWRAPALKPQTVAVLKPERLERLTIDNHFKGFVNAVYGRHELAGLVVRDKKGNAHLQTILDGVEYVELFGRHISLADVLVFWGPEGGRCMWAISPQTPLNQRDDPQVRILQPVSKESLILAQPAGPPPPASMFGPDPGQDCWCYYFEKADLARQTQDWPAAAALWEQVRAKGLAPADPREWEPFRQALQALGRQEEARELTRALEAAPPKPPRPAPGG